MDRVQELGNRGNVIRLFKVYYPLRTLVLLAGEALIVWLSFVLGTMLRNQDSWLLLNVEAIPQDSGGYGSCALLSHWLTLRFLQPEQELGTESAHTAGAGIRGPGAFRDRLSVFRISAGEWFGSGRTRHPDLHLFCWLGLTAGW